jgi:hypothetical protein
MFYENSEASSCDFTVVLVTMTYAASIKMYVFMSVLVQVNIVVISQCDNGRRSVIMNDDGPSCLTVCDLHRCQ